MRVSAPFPCSYALVGLKKWATINRGGLAVVCDLSVAGARMLSETVLAPGDEIVGWQRTDAMTVCEVLGEAPALEAAPEGYSVDENAAVTMRTIKNG